MRRKTSITPRVLVPEILEPERKKNQMDAAQRGEARPYYGGAVFGYPPEH